MRVHTSGRQKRKNIGKRPARFRRALVKVVSREFADLWFDIDPRGFLGKPEHFYQRPNVIIPSRHDLGIGIGFALLGLVLNLHLESAARVRARNPPTNKRSLL